jgi:hypothetical protein
MFIKFGHWWCNSCLIATVKMAHCPWLDDLILIILLITPLWIIQKDVFDADHGYLWCRLWLPSFVGPKISLSFDTAVTLWAVVLDHWYISTLRPCVWRRLCLVIWGNCQKAGPFWPHLMVSWLYNFLLFKLLLIWLIDYLWYFFLEFRCFQYDGWRLHKRWLIPLFPDDHFLWLHINWGLKFNDPWCRIKLGGINRYCRISLRF